MINNEPSWGCNICYLLLIITNVEWRNTSIEYSITQISKFFTIIERALSRFELKMFIFFLLLLHFSLSHVYRLFLYIRIWVISNIQNACTIFVMSYIFFIHPELSFPLNCSYCRCKLQLLFQAYLFLFDSLL